MVWLLIPGHAPKSLSWARSQVPTSAGSHKNVSKDGPIPVCSEKAEQIPPSSALCTQECHPLSRCLGGNSRSMNFVSAISFSGANIRTPVTDRTSIKVEINSSAALIFSAL